MIHPTLTGRLPEITTLFKKHRVRKAYAFGSVCTKDFNESSDIDLLIDFEDNLDPIHQGESWWALRDELEQIFNREIDLITEKSLRNPYFIEELQEKRQLIYG
jgi:predicted nucleotidyltransferase